MIFKDRDIVLLGSHHYSGPKGDYELGAFDVHTKVLRQSQQARVQNIKPKKGLFRNVES